MTNDEIKKQIQNLVKNCTTENEEIFELLDRQDCELLLLYSNNPKFIDKLSKNRIINIISNNERYKACRPIFDQEQISYVVVKGAVLSKEIYNDPFLKNSGDIDILICKSDADKIKKLLHQNGFFQGKIINGKVYYYTRRQIIFQTTFTHQMATFIKETNNSLCPYVCIDVNTNVMWGENNNKIDMEKFLMHKCETELFGCKFYKLTAEMEFIHLCLHNYKDMNSLYLLINGSLKLKLFYEIYMYLKNVSLDCNLILEICEKMQIGEYIYTCIYYTQQIFDDEKILKYLDLLKQYKNQLILESFGLIDEERKKWNVEIIERLFKINVPKHIYSMLSNKEKDKICKNINHM